MMTRFSSRSIGALAVSALLVFWMSPMAIAGEEPLIRLERVPDGGIQPQVTVDDEGVVHLVYFKGEPANGDLYYCRRGINDSQFSTAIQVNSVPASAIATGTIRGAQIAVGADQRIHVAWNGSSQSQPRGPEGETPLLYTRINAAGDAFEPQRNLIDHAYGLDGGACIAADTEGHVYVAWHAGEGSQGESARRVWMVRSDDNGETYSTEQAIDGLQVGACGCCGMRGTVTPAGEVMFLYRSAAIISQRDIYLLRSNDSGEEFESRKLHPWEIAACPMSSEAFVHLNDQTWAAWETDGQVYFADVTEGGRGRDHAVAVPGSANQRKHPMLTGNGTGQVLIVWTEGTGWNRGGSLAWQLVDSNGRPVPVAGSSPGIPVWSFAAAFPGPDGSFVILY